MAQWRLPSDLVSRAPRGGSYLGFIASIAVRINARGVERGIRALTVHRNAFLLAVLSPCASHGIVRAE
jgi:hypothetical protein